MMHLINSSQGMGFPQTDVFGMSRRWLMALSLLMAAFVLNANPVYGEYSMLAGEFDGGERKLADFNCSISRAGSPYQAVEFSVTKGGGYRIANAFTGYDNWDYYEPGYGIASVVSVYQGTINDASILETTYRETPYSITLAPLKAGITYTLLVVSPCYLSELATGVWTVIFEGAGQVQSNARREIPAISFGEFDPAGPSAKGRCGDKLLNLEVAYKQLGPFRVSRSGSYFLSDVHDSSMQNCHAIYSAPLTPSNVEAHLVGSDYSNDLSGNLRFQDQWTVELEAETDYWMVVQPQSGVTPSGSYFFVMAPPAPFRINPGMTGLWADLSTPGQGMHLDVFNSIDKVFMAWFTYDMQRPSPGATAVLGDPGHRWLTGLGAIDGNSSEIDALWTAGGIFDSSSPRPSRSVDGQIRLEFDNCTSGRAIYVFEATTLSGVVKLQRPYEDALGIALCEQFNRGPGMPGPL